MSTDPPGRTPVGGVPIGTAPPAGNTPPAGSVPPPASAPPAGSQPVGTPPVSTPPVGTPPINVPPIGIPIGRGSGLDAKTPLLLLPVHIQTRFVDDIAADKRPELWVRIFPDQIAVNSHEPPLTAQEISDGEVYWNAVWQAGNPPPTLDDAEAPWRLLASAYTPQRAAWIALQLTPTNLTQQPVAATPSGTPPTPAPVLPSVPTRATSWEQPAIADALPDAWTVVLISGTQSSLFRGSPIIQPLAVSLTPNGGAFPPGSPVDPGLTWMIDFNTAVAAGMALKIPLTSAQRSAGFDRILVYGTRGSDAAAPSTFATLLNAHHYTDGFALVPQGSATNNTPDAPSAFSRKDPNYALSFATERQAPLTSNPSCDGVAFATAIGIPTTILDHVAAADGTDSQNGGDMLGALWPATLGYFLAQMMTNVFSSDQIESAREFVLKYAMPRGPVPAFRVGRTPYGVLPVTSFAKYAMSSDIVGPIETGLVGFVKKLWPTWLSSSSSAPHMQRGQDPDKNLMAVLGMDASSMTFQGREVMGPAFLWNWLSFLGVPQSFQGQWWQNYALFGRILLNTFGYPQWDPRVISFGFDVNSFPVTWSTVQSGVLSETAPLTADADLGGGTKGNYIDWLRTASAADVQAENYPGPKPTSLLYKILRQSMLLDYVNLAGVDEVRAGKLTGTQLQENELISVVPSATTLTPWQLLVRPSNPNPHLSWAEYLDANIFPVGSAFTRLNDVRTSLTRLASLPTAELDRLLTETLDACSHRLDVWATAIATSLLDRARTQSPTGLYLGCYGWVEDIRPEAGRTPVVGTELAQVQLLDTARQRLTTLPVSLPVPLQPITDNGGYIFAPSQAQGAAAAVLRNGYMTHQNSAEEALLSIDLSSARVRKALWLIAGVQQGQSLNALLGYLFEDAMHTANLDVYIQPFRNAYPVVGAKLTASSAPSESVAASNVVDGLALRTAWDSGKLATGGNWGTGLPAPGADQNSVITIFQMLDDYADALGDLSISEAVFQVMRGNVGNGALMDAISRGSRPPHPDIVDTPRGGIDLTHRVTVLLAGPPPTSSAWASVAAHPRAAAEPWLNAWLSQLLPDPAIVRCQVQYVEAGATQTITIALRDLSLGPLDLLSLGDAAQVPQRSELENRVLYAAAVPADAQNVQIIFQAGATLPAGSVLFPDALYLAQTLQQFIGAARALGPQDLTTPETVAASAGGVVNMADLQARASAAISGLSTAIATLTTAIAGLPGAPDPVRAALLQCSYYGVTGSIPGTTSGPDPALALQASNVLGILQGRSNSVAGITLSTAQLSDLTGVFETIFGNAFTVLPQFTPPNLAITQAAFAQSSSLVSSDPQAPTRWLRQLAHVRPAIGRLDLAMSAAQALSTGALYPPTLSLGQVPPPATPPDVWLGLPINTSNPPDKGRVAFACVTQGDATSQSSYVGLLVDEWLERIPSTQEDASLVFHFEEPGARAPQAALLAVCPDNRATWDDEMLQAILGETLELAKIRAVDLASVEQVGQILPALYFALNLQGATVSTQFAVLEKVNVVTGLS
jgi:hypothetical protein